MQTELEIVISIPAMSDLQVVVLLGTLVNSYNSYESFKKKSAEENKKKTTKML